jgi:tRNA(fMet)-specific endonuclease VapC
VIIADTDVCIELLRGNRRIIEKRQACGDEIAVSFMTAAELFYGAEKSQKRQANSALVERFLLSVRVVHTNSDIVQMFGQLKARLSQAAIMLPDADMLIAATVLSMDATLITGNVRHFQRITGLKIENWIG